MDEQKNLNGKVKIVCTLILLAMLIAVTGCSKDDDEIESLVVLKAQTFEIIGLNDCSLSSGSGSTTFLYIPYSAPSGTILKKLHRKTTVSSGESNEDVTTVFSDENNTIEWATCLRFGSQTWMEFEIRMESENGALSNPSVVRINKPAGAN